MANEGKLLDHLFRHQYGKMVSILSRIFGLRHLPMIEDAVQDTFIAALKTWRRRMPDDPEAWLTAAAKNRMIDLFRKLRAEEGRVGKFDSGPSSIALQELFLDSQVADSQLRMIFTACNPVLKSQDQIAFALKTIAGLGVTEIAGALLLKPDTIKKRLARARKTIIDRNIKFEIPQGKALQPRLDRVLEVIYLIFNEGFHSNNRDVLVREDLCGEAIRLCKMVLTNKSIVTPDCHALFALLCFQSSRLRSKTDADGAAISLRLQDRSLWYQPLIAYGHVAMEAAVQTNHFGSYHYEAAIASEHARAPTYDQTNWQQISDWYEALDQLNPNPLHKLNLAVVCIELGDYSKAHRLLTVTDHSDLEQRTYLYHGLWAEYYWQTGDLSAALQAIDTALMSVNNQAEKSFLEAKKERIAGNK